MSQGGPRRSTFAAHGGHRVGRLSTVRTLLVAAGDTTTVRVGSGDESYESWERSALATAVYKGHTDVVKALLEHCADANEADPQYDWSGVRHSAARFNRAGAVAALLDEGADANVSPSTPSSMELFAFPLQRGADSNATGRHGIMALHSAVHWQGPGFLETIDLLLRWGASEAAASRD